MRNSTSQNLLHLICDMCAFQSRSPDMQRLRCLRCIEKATAYSSHMLGGNAHVIRVHRQEVGCSFSSQSVVACACRMRSCCIRQAVTCHKRKSKKKQPNYADTQKITKTQFYHIAITTPNSLLWHNPLISCTHTQVLIRRCHVMHPTARGARRAQS